MSEMIEQDTSRDSESDCDVPSEFGTCPCEAELEKLPEVVIFIKRLQSFIYKQQSKLCRLHKELKEHVSEVGYVHVGTCMPFLFSQPSRCNVSILNVLRIGSVLYSFQFTACIEFFLLQQDTVEFINIL
jgi:hypothetical protein